MLISIEIMLLAITFLILISSLSFDDTLGQTYMLGCIPSSSSFLAVDKGSIFEPINKQDTSIEGISYIVSNISEMPLFNSFYISIFLLLFLITIVIIFMFVHYMDREYSIRSDSSSESGDDNTNNRRLKKRVMRKMVLIIGCNNIYNNRLNLYNRWLGLNSVEANYMRRNAYLLPDCYLVDRDILYRSGRVFVPSISDLVIVLNHFPGR